jgi:hypothetical protein
VPQAFGSARLMATSTDPTRNGSRAALIPSEESFQDIKIDTECDTAGHQSFPFRTVRKFPISQSQSANERQGGYHIADTGNSGGYYPGSGAGSMSNLSNQYNQTQQAVGSRSGWIHQISEYGYPGQYGGPIYAQETTFGIDSSQANSAAFDWFGQQHESYQEDTARYPSNQEEEGTIYQDLLTAVTNPIIDILEARGISPDSICDSDRILSTIVSLDLEEDVTTDGIDIRRLASDLESQGEPWTRLAAGDMDTQAFETIVHDNVAQLCEEAMSASACDVAMSGMVSKSADASTGWATVSEESSPEYAVPNAHGNVNEDDTSVSEHERPRGGRRLGMTLQTDTISNARLVRSLGACLRCKALREKVWKKRA